MSARFIHLINSWCAKNSHSATTNSEPTVHNTSLMKTV